jgi:transposase-like protein
MPAHSKFTEETRTLILSAVQFGASLSTAAESAGINHSTLSRWKKQAESQPLGRFAQFMEQVEAVRAKSRLRLAEVAYRGAMDSPRMALKMLEILEPAFSPPIPRQPAQMTTPVIILKLDDGAPIDALPSSEVRVLEPYSGADTA